MQMVDKISQLGIVPVVKLNDAKDAVPLGKALIAGGLPVAEITFRTDAAEESIRNIARELPDMLVGAGTVLSIDQAKRALDAGAKFIVTPGFNKTVVSWCIEQNIPVFPGCPTTSDVEAALELGLTVLKFFPAEAMGGLNTIKAICAPYTKARFMPTGGVNEKNLNDYLAFDKIVACGGSWMVKDDLVESGQFDKITELTRTAVQTMLGFEIRHVGINCDDENEAVKVAQRFATLFGWPVKLGNSSVFAGTQVEAMKTQYLGQKGHIAVATNSVARAKAYLESLGVEFNEDAQTIKNGKYVAAYLKEEIGGFAVHLLQK